MSDLQNTIVDMAKGAKKAARTLVSLSSTAKNDILLHMANSIDAKRIFIQSENQKDLSAGKEKEIGRAHV